MSVATVVVCGFVGAIALAVLRKFVVDEVSGQVRNSLADEIERAIDMLPVELQEKWGEEWRAEFASVADMPFSAMRFALGVRRASLRLAADYEPAIAVAGGAPNAHVLRRAGTRHRRAHGRLLPNGRVDFVRQLCVAALAYVFYRLAGALLAGGGGGAFGKARDIILLERQWHIFVEANLQESIARSAVLATTAAALYAYVLPAIAAGGLAYMYVARNRHYYHVRDEILVATVLALLGSALLSQAPPRFLPEWGFTDAVATLQPSFLLASPYAAFPSMQVAVALILARRLSAGAGSWSLRLSWASLPLLVAFLAVATANAFVIDVVFSVAVAMLAPGITRSLARLSSRLIR